MAARISSGLVMSVVVILIALEHSTAKCDQGNLDKEADNDLFLQSDNRFLLGRKILQQMKEKPAQIPEQTKPADLDNSLPEAQKLEHSQESMAHVTKPKQDHSITKKDESSAFLEAADEVANLMRKDYKGMAKRKPPIHNNDPGH